MEKKFLLGLLVIAGLFYFTGCTADNEELSNDSTKKEKFYELKDDEPKGYSNVSDFG